MEQPKTLPEIVTLTDDQLRALAMYFKKLGAAEKNGRWDSKSEEALCNRLIIINADT